MVHCELRCLILPQKHPYVSFSFGHSVVDTVDPVWSGCPGDIEDYVPFGTASKAVTWTPPNASDAISSVITMASHSPGAEFDVGDTKVVYTATDVAGNRAYCNFTITITAYNFIACQQSNTILYY